MSLLEVSGLSKTYTTRFGGAKVEALKSVTFSVESGEYVAVMGESGSGKTTLLNLLAALDRPTGGTVLLGGQNLAEIPEERAAAFRRDHLGFVFQDFSLLDTFSLEDNILLPLVLQGKSRGEMKSRLVPLADRLGIFDLLKKYPYEISGGQKQRAAVARALKSDWPTTMPARKAPKAMEASKNRADPTAMPNASTMTASVNRSRVPVRAT